MSRITDYPQKAIPVVSDVMVLVDVADTTQSPAGSTKQVTVGSLPFDAAGAAAAAQAAAFLAPTSVKTGNYTASPGDFVPVDASGGSRTITLPNAPADKTQVGVKIIALNAEPWTANPNIVTVSCSGAAVMNKAGGVTTRKLTLLNEAAVFQYSAASGIWYTISDDLPFGSLQGPSDWFNVMTYAAVGGGLKTVSDAAISATSSTLTSASAGFSSSDVGKFMHVAGAGILPVPAAPSVSSATSGGTVVAGTYGIKVTYVNAAGETVASTASSIVTTTATSTITILPPGMVQTATGWYAYVTQVNGATYTRQQAPGSPTAMGKSLILTAPPTSSGVNPPVSNTATGAYLATTISAYVNSTTVTLAASATTTVSAASAAYAFDDTQAIQNALSDCGSFYHLPSHVNHGGTVYLPPGTYVITSPLITQNNNVKIQGSSEGVSTILMAPAFSSSYPTCAGVIVTGVAQIRDVTIAGQGISSYPVANGIEVLYRNSIIEDTQIVNANGWGVELLNKTLAGGNANNSGGSWINVSGNAAGGFHFNGSGGTNTGTALYRCGIAAGTATGQNANLDAFFAETNAGDICVIGFGGSVSAGTGAIIHYAANGASSGNNLAPGFFMNCDIGGNASGPCVLLEDGTTGFGNVHSIWFFNCTLQQCQTGVILSGGSTARFNGTQIPNNTTHGVSASGTASAEFLGCTFNEGFTNGQGQAGTNYDINWNSTGTAHVSNVAHWSTIVVIGQKGVQASMNDPNHVLQVVNCDFTGIGTPVFAPGALPKFVRHCPGYNPVGTISVSVPASGTPTAALASDVIFYITAGTSSCTAQVSGGPAITIPANAVVPVTVPAQQTLTLTYSAAPTFVVYGL